MSDYKTSLIIPCYWANQELIDVTERCLDSLKETGLELIIVDDGSPFMHEPSRSTIFISNQKNRGYAGAVNNGLASATGENLIICNSDIEFVQPEWLEHLLKPLIDWGFDISSIRTSDSDGWLTENRLEEGAKFGSLWAMRREVYETIGDLDENYGKGYFEDLDFHKRAEDAGFRVVKNHAGLVQHQGKATFNVIDPNDEHYEKAKAIYLAKWGELW